MPGLKIGLALGGGGARGYAHLGVIRSLKRHSIPIDVIAGTSMGAVIGGAYACGINLHKLELLLKSIDLNKLLRFPRSSLLGLMGNTAQEMLFQGRDWRVKDTERTENLIEFFNLFSQRKAFSELRMPFAIAAVDVDTGEEVVLKNGSVSRALASAIAIPGIHYPVKVDGRFLVDGGVINKVPVELAFALGADVVIAVDVSTPTLRGGVSSVEILMQAESIMMRELNQVKLKSLKDQYGGRYVLLQPSVNDVRTLALGDVETPARAGERETERRIAEIKALVVPRSV
ncbi:patatin-like phospholipase family protein [Candidatus Acetothermia bacterium]|nr:patatin-like phospholipase family protein [Candidatus Acetothermia bacterium]MBI3642854.1 patatin-like phospholipase family protein [Candidatus Acetothermia bacterium]